MPPASAAPQPTEGPALGKRKERCESAAGDGSGAETILDGRDTSPANLKRIKTAYDRNGLVCVSFLAAAKCDDLILEQWKHVLLKQEWAEEYRMKVRARDGTVLDVDNADHRREFLKSVVGPLDTKTRKMMETGWPLHRGFGACCDPAVFHLEGVWGIRQDPDLYQIASTIAEEDNLWVDVNRSIQKLPGQGENEFLHFDFNPFMRQAMMAGGGGDQGPKGVCGKACYTPSRFVYVEGTHTDQFQTEFVTEYKEHYPNVKMSDKKFGLDAKKPDPLELAARKRVMLVPAGSLVIWHPRLLHGQMKTPIRDPVEYGTYVGFFPAGSRQAYYDKCQVDELQDRLNSYLFGRMPTLWPSVDTVNFHPKKFENFPHLLQAYIKKLGPGHPMICTRIAGAGHAVPAIKPMPLLGYQPPALSDLGVSCAREWATTAMSVCV